MSPIHIYQNKNTSEVKRSATQALEKLIESNSGKEILLLVSGGSALDLLNINNKYLSPHITIGVLDERFSESSIINNFQQLTLTSLYISAQQAGCRFIDSKVKADESIGDLCLHLEQELRVWKKNNPQGVVIITQGMGPDGHIAGIMPYPENAVVFQRLFMDEKRWVVDYDAGTKNEYPLRITVSMSFLRLVDHSIIYVVGSKKSEMLKKVLRKRGELYKLPSTIIHEMKDVQLFTDCEIN